MENNKYKEKVYNNIKYRKKAKISNLIKASLSKTYNESNMRN